MISFRQSCLADHIDAALTSMAPATAARLTHPDQVQQQCAIEIMAQTLAARLYHDPRAHAGGDASSSPRLPIDLR